MDDVVTPLMATSKDCDTPAAGCRCRHPSGRFAMGPGSAQPQMTSGHNMRDPTHPLGADDQHLPVLASNHNSVGN